MADELHEEETTFGRLARSGLLHVASAGTASAIGNGIDQAISHGSATDVTGLNGEQVTDGSIMHHGPTDAGELLDRPSGGYLAHASAANGVGVEQGHDISHIARNIDDAGTLTVDGNRIAVLDYVPGGDFVQLAAGHANPTQIMMTLAQHGIAQEMGHANPDGTTGGHEAGRARDTTVGMGDDAFESEATAGRMGGAAGGRGRTASSGVGQHVPDGAENAQDLEELALMHRRDLDVAVETSDQASVHTQIHAHGRTLEIDTQFEARAPDNDLERAEAAEHVGEVAHGATAEHEHDAPRMHFRSKVQAHLDAMAQDEGLSL